MSEVTCLSFVNEEFFKSILVDHTKDGLVKIVISEIRLIVRHDFQKLDMNKIIAENSFYKTSL